MFVEVCLLLGLVGVASNPSPYYAALGLVGGAGAGCILLVKGGVGFLSLVLFLIYLGGMMVVFAYSAALVAEPYPEAWGSTVALVYLAVYGVVTVIGLLVSGGLEANLYTDECGAVLGEWWGVSEVLCSGGWLLFFGGWGLLLTLFIVLELVWGQEVGALRAV